MILPFGIDLYYTSKKNEKGNKSINNWKKIKDIAITTVNPMVYIVQDITQRYLDATFFFYIRFRNGKFR